MMRHPAPIFQGGFGRRDVEAAIDLQGIAADDLSVESLGNAEREIGLAGAGGSQDNEQAQAFFRERKVSPRRIWSWYWCTASRK